MVKIGRYQISNLNAIVGVAVLLVSGIGGLYLATPGPLTADSLGIQSTIGRAEVLIGTASVAEADQATVIDSEIRGGQTLFGTFEEPGADINPGETVDYCADIEFKTDTDADYTYIGTYLSTSDFDFPQEGDTQWSDYHRVGDIVEICMPFTAPGGGTYDMSMWLNSISERNYDTGRIDEDTFEVVGDTDSPPEIQDMNCENEVNVGETAYITPDVQDDTGISRWYWDATDHYGNAGDETAAYSWDTTGTKTVELTVTDQAGQTDRDSCRIDVVEEQTEPPGGQLTVNLLDILLGE